MLSSIVNELVDEDDGWSVTESRMADVVFLKPDEPGSQVLIDASAQLQTLTPIVCGRDKSGINWSIPEVCSRTEVESILRSIEEQNQTRKKGQRPRLVASAEPAFSHQPLNPEWAVTMMEQIKGVAKSRSLVRIKVGNIACMADPGRDILFTTNALSLKLIELLIQHREFSFEALRNEGGHIKSPEGNSCSFTNFIWTLGYRLPLPESYQSHQAMRQNIKLKQWPNFTQLNHAPMHMAVAALMVRDGASIQEVCKLTQRQEEDIVRFYNACLALDLIQQGNGSGSLAVKVQDAESHNASILQRLFNKLRA